MSERCEHDFPENYNGDPPCRKCGKTHGTILALGDMGAALTRKMAVESTPTEALIAELRRRGVGDEFEAVMDCGRPHKLDDVEDSGVPWKAWTNGSRMRVYAIPLPGESG